MNILILYCLDKEASNGQFPKFKVFHFDTNPDKIFDYLKSQVSAEEFETMLDGGSEDDLKEVLRGGFDVQGDHTYWNLSTEPVE